MFTISDLADTKSVTVYPETMPQEVIQVKSRNESVSGHVHVKLKKNRRRWTITCYMDDNMVDDFEELLAETYVNVAIGESYEQVCELYNYSCNTMTTENGGFHQVKFVVEERGW
jgi:hypothetical protein